MPRLIVPFLILVVLALAGCAGGQPFNPFTWFSPPKATPTEPITHGEEQMWLVVVTMAMGTFFPGVACMVGGTWIKPLRDAGTILLVIAFGTVAAGLLWAKIGDWIGALALVAAATALVVWGFWQWKERRWKHRVMQRETELKEKAQNGGSEEDKRAAMLAAEQLHYAMEA